MIDACFETAESLHHLKVPARNAYAVADEIMSEIQEVLGRIENGLVLMSCGCLATVLASRLCKCGWQAVDIGNIALLIGQVDEARFGGIPGGAQ